MPRTDTAVRVITATPDAIYEAFIDPKALAKWLPPAGMSGHIETFEPRPGGHYRMTLTYDDATTGGKSGGNADVVEGRFVDLVPGQRVVQQVEFASDDPAFAGIMTMTWSLASVPGGTEVTVTADNVPDGISKQDHADGMASSLANLAAFLA
jgi:uncharacterized protein YndB with AHSA1/START domain